MSAMEVHLFNDWLWDMLSFHVNFCIKSSMTSATYEILELRGVIVFNYLCMRNLIITYLIYFFARINRINTCKELKNWASSLEAVKNLPVLWHMLHRCGDNKGNVSGAVTHVKCFFILIMKNSKKVVLKI